MIALAAEENEKYERILIQMKNWLKKEIQQFLFIWRRFDRKRDWSWLRKWVEVLKLLLFYLF